MDEIGNLPLALQAKLLTVLQNRNITRIGSNKVVPVDIRLISATNKDIPEMVKQGLFREDLFYRINTIHLEIPPLRERGDDILLFVETFLHRFASKYQRPEMRMHEPNNRETTLLPLAGQYPGTAARYRESRYLV